jgi:hypothetical protein
MRNRTCNADSFPDYNCLSQQDGSYLSMLEDQRLQIALVQVSVLKVDNRNEHCRSSCPCGSAGFETLSTGVFPLILAIVSSV